MKLTLHFGAHKTASSYLQRTLAHNRDLLRRNGVGYVHLAMMRQKVTNPLAWARNFPDDKARVKASKTRAANFLQRMWGERLLGDGETPQRHLLLSDENLIGVPREMVNWRRLYPTLTERMEVLQPMLGDAVPRIYLCIRNPVTYAPSIFCEALVARNAAEFDLRSYRKDWLKHQPRWSNVIGKLRHTFPNAEIRVWDFADFRALESRILHEMADVPNGETFEPLTDIIRPSITDKAARKLLWIQRWKGNQARFEALPEVRRQYADGPKLQLWKSKDLPLLEDLYAEDLAGIAAMENVVLIRP
ncbi:hypothetical protein [Algicella marina]|uniref:Sulfotransferase family protein n=1 Tax=Algicella marina TaxID=2683284 RepID=A0A6P1STY1_9RHOB|nr:hypothetical protein [Algicella marina]QHQ34154.1 hypothetical protein GO499_02600 [Algicella marina]